MTSATEANKSILVKNSDISMGFCMLILLIFVVLPLPVLMLDVLLSFSLALSMVIILAAFLIKEPLEFSSFPYFKNILTIFRLALIIASTKIILIQGHQGNYAAGKVIQFYGNLMVFNNAIISIFIISFFVAGFYLYNLFGSSRIFQLSEDILSVSIPEKRKAIDLELKSKNISDKDAKALSKNINLESEYYGSLQNSFQFNRWDFLAGLVFSLLVFLIGSGVGTIYLGMDFAEGIKNYGILAIGSGLAYFLPGLLITLAGEHIVTSPRPSKKRLAHYFNQFSKFPNVLIYVSIGFIVLAMVPGTPHFAFFLMSVLTGVSGFFLSKEKKDREKIKEDSRISIKSPSVLIESILPLDIMEILVGKELKFLANLNNNVLVDKIKIIRQKYALEMGLVIPKIPIRVGEKLEPNEYLLLINGEAVFRGEAYQGRMLAIGKHEIKGEIEGIKTIDPVTGKSGLWILPKLKNIAETEGLSLKDLPSVVISIIEAAIKQYGHELLGQQEVSNLLANFGQRNPKLVDELIPNKLSLGQIKKVLQNLVSEQISIRDLRTILEILADNSTQTSDTDLLTEKVRSALSRSISKKIKSSDGSVYALEFDKNTEELISNSLVDLDGVQTLVFDPDMADKLISKIREAMQSVSIFIGRAPIVVISPSIRRSFRNFIKPFFSELLIVSYNEIVPSVKINSLKVISLDEN